MDQPATHALSPIHSAVRRQPALAAVVVALAWLPATLLLHPLGRAALPASEHETRLADGIEQLIMAAVALFVMSRVGWLRSSWITSRPALVGGRWALTGLTAPACSA